MLIWVWAAWDSNVEVDQHVPLWWRLTCCAGGALTIAVNLSRDPHNVLMLPIYRSVPNLWTVSYLATRLARLLVKGILVPIPNT